MAEGKNVRNVDKGQKPNAAMRVANFIKRLPGRIAQPFKNTWRELKKATWPTRKDLLNYTMIVLAFMAFMGVVIGLLDMGSSALVAVLASWAG
ncbi:MAG: preprotein translocase subunit SecE [Eubacteriales bacterium]|nr:preprotein translocase subunit SecE [Eubacteriales bacterium]